MATSTVTSTIKDASGNALEGVTVTARLMPGPGFRISDSSEIAHEVATATDSLGVWSLALERSSNISPANSWYLVTEEVPAAFGGTRTWRITVGDAGGTLFGSLVSALAPAAELPTALTLAAGDARYAGLGAANVFAGVNSFTTTTKFKAGAPLTETAAMVRILGGEPWSAPLPSPQHGLGVLVYNEGTDPGSSGTIYAAVNTKHKAGPLTQHKVWGVVADVQNQSPDSLSTVGFFSTVRNSGATPTWAAAFEVWDSLDDGGGEDVSDANLVCLELLNLHKGAGTSHGLTVIGGGDTPGTRGIWVQPGNSVNGEAGWSVGIDVDIGPVDPATVGVRLRKAPDGFPPAWAGRYLQALNASSNEVFGIDTTGAPVVTNYTAASNVGLLKFSRSGSLVGQVGIDSSDRPAFFTGGGTQTAAFSGSIADTETALLVRRNVGGTLSLQRVSMGAADSGGAGFKALRVPN